MNGLIADLEAAWVVSWRRPMVPRRRRGAGRMFPPMTDQDERVDELDEGYVPPDPDEPAPMDLASVIGDVRPWGSLLLALSYAAVFAAMAFRGEVGDRDALVAWGA